MATIIHPTAIVDSKAELGDNVEIGPFASVGPNVKIGANTVVKQGAIIDGHTTIGEDCQIFPYACIGMKTQDLKYVDGSISFIEIGNRTVIREFATVHLGTKDGEKTKIGDDCLFMCYCHAAHGVVLGNHVICSNSVQIAGDVTIDDYAVIGGCTGIHQFCHIGCHSMVGGAVKVRQDIPPYMLCDMSDGALKVIGPNIVGLKRRGFSSDSCSALKEAFRFIYHSGMNRSQALERVEHDVDQVEEVKTLLSFYRNSSRGVC
jgi:UDP-N-acetylglucosamine acyltransferase